MNLGVTMRKLFIILLLLPSLVSAETVFSEPEDEDEVAPPEGDPYFSYFTGGPVVKPKKLRWDKFRSLEEYGQSSETTSSEVVYDPHEEEVKQLYKKSKDPFSNSDRIKEVEERLNPAKE